MSIFMLLRILYYWVFILETILAAEIKTGWVICSFVDSIHNIIHSFIVDMEGN